MKHLFSALLIFALLGALLAPGCKEKTKSAPPQDAQASADSHKNPDFKLTRLKTLEVKPSDAPQTLVTDAVTVTLPPNLLKTGQTLSVSSVEDPSAPPVEGFVRIASVDVSIGDLKQFDKPIQIEFPIKNFDPKNTTPPELQYFVAYYDPAEGTWVDLPAAFDPQTQKLVVQTTHLCTIEVFFTGLSYLYLPCDGFGIYYNLATVKKKAQDYVSQNPSDVETVPDFISDVRQFIGDAIKAYAKHDLKPYTRPYILVVDETNSMYRWDVRRILITFSDDTSAKLRYVAAHELFHSVQQNKYNMIGWHDNNWFLETSAEYFASRVAQDNYGLMGKLSEEKNGFDLLDFPLDHFGKPKDTQGRLHQYQNAWFIDYLAKKHSPDDPKAYGIKLYKSVADYSGGPLGGLDQFFKAQHGETNGLARQFDDYALFYLFGIDSRMPKSASPDKVHPQASKEILLVDLKETSANPKPLTLKPNYTAQAVCIRAKAENNKERVFQITVDALPKDTAVYVCRMTGNNRTSSPWILGSYKTLEEAKKPIEAPLVQDDALYLVFANHSDSTQTITFKVEEKVSLAIRRPLFEVEKGVIGYEYKFSPISSAIPDDAQFAWNFGDGASATGKNVSHKYTSAGTFQVGLTAAWGNQKEETQIAFTIAPDSPVGERKEVTFQVYRIFKNAMGTSKQACNSFTITVLKNGTVVDSAKADATNGALSLTLPVGESYEYQATYQYSMPAGSGRCSGKFSVTSAGANFITIETGTESQ